jgi:hypothetical protein
MSWFKNLFRKKRLPARDHIGRFLANDKGEMLYTDSPVEEIERAKAKALKRDKERAIATINLTIQKKINSTCGCDISLKKCSCAPKTAPAKKAPVKKAPAKSTEKKTAIKSDLADKPVAKKKPAPKKK